MMERIFLHRFLFGFPANNNQALHKRNCWHPKRLMVIDKLKPEDRDFVGNSCNCR